MPNQAKSTGTTKPGVKGAFIRKHPNKTVKEIIALGKEAGIEIKDSFVYNIRSADKKAKAAGKAPQPSTKKAAANGHKRSNAQASSDVDAGVKSQLRTFVLRVGLDRAPQVFEQVLNDLKREVESAAD